MSAVPLVDRIHNRLRGLLAPLDEVAGLVPDGNSVLELGCGQGLVLKSLAERAGRLVGVDNDARKIRMARQLLGTRAELWQTDIELAVERITPGSFDCLILSDTLSSFPVSAQDQLLRLAVSRLRPGNILILSFVDGGARGKRYLSLLISRITYALRVSRSLGQRFAYRSAEDLRSALEGAGCVVEQRVLHRFPPRPIPHVALIARAGRAVRQPSVTLAVLNLRLGGQVSAALALAGLLQRRGLSVRWAVPEGVESPGGTHVDAFAALPFHTRLRRTWAMLRQLRPSHDGDILHLILPSPAFAWVAAAIRWPEDRVILQYEGPSTRFDFESARAFMREPTLLAPRLILNNTVLARLWRRLRVTHLASHPSIDRQLRRMGFERIAMIENLASVEASNIATRGSLELGRADGEIWIAYVGHAHAVKGADLLVDAFERAARRRPQLRLLLALTRDGKSARLQRRISRLSSRNRIRVEGLLRVADVLGAVDALALPYRSALSTTLYPSLLLEADEARCPAIVSRLPELTPVFAWAAPTLSVVTPGDVQSLEEALCHTTRRTDSEWSSIVAIRPQSERVDAFEALYRRLIA